MTTPDLFIFKLPRREASLTVGDLRASGPGIMNFLLDIRGQTKNALS
jgi:hypothetical protein